MQHRSSHMRVGGAGLGGACVAALLWLAAPAGAESLAEPVPTVSSPVAEGAPVEPTAPTVTTPEVDAAPSEPEVVLDTAASQVSQTVDAVEEGAERDVGGTVGSLVESASTGPTERSLREAGAKLTEGAQLTGAGAKRLTGGEAKPPPVVPPSSPGAASSAPGTPAGPVRAPESPSPFHPRSGEGIELPAIWAAAPARDRSYFGLLLSPELRVPLLPSLAVDGEGLSGRSGGAVGGLPPRDGNGPPHPLTMLAAAASGLGGSSFVPIAAVLALLALAAPAIFRRAQELADLAAPAPFACALERPG
jgi:hypothetical protein